MITNSKDKIKLGVIIGNRDFFPDALITDGRTEVLGVLNELGIDCVVLDEQTTPFGAVETWEHAKACAALFRKHADEIAGILVSLPNFGDEKAVAETIKLSGLRVPILVQAFPDDLDKFNVERRRDAFCGKISVCNNLYQYGFPFSVTELHTIRPNTETFKADLRKFAAVCRVVKFLPNARLGASALARTTSTPQREAVAGVPGSACSRSTATIPAKPPAWMTTLRR